ncbi:TonB-dependent receptor [Vicingaceae bacterium]|nr:TonB-dependent receptor [Vicingaceae bacterium]MDC1452583.1 TonB-dependent receptor [Vicingaceae bacterium]
MRILGTILLLAVASNLLSQNTISDTVEIEPVIVNGNSLTTNQEVLDSSILSNPQHLNLGDLLSKKSHLFIKSYGIGSLATVSLRGSGAAHTQVNWNGISLNSSMNGSSDLALFPLFFMDEVSVKYGLNSLADGTGGIGGAVNISTLPEFGKQLSLYTSYLLGSFGQEQLNLKIKGGDDKFQSITKIIYNQADNNFEYRDLTTEGFPNKRVNNARFIQKGVMQNLFLKLPSNQLLEASLWLFNSERKLPPLITLRNNTELQEDLAIKSLIKYSKYFNSSTLKVTSAYLSDELNYQNERAGIVSTSATNSFRTRLDYEFNFRKIDVHAQAKYDHDNASADGLTTAVNQNRTEFYLSAQRFIIKRIKTSLSIRSLNIMQAESYLLPQLRIDYQLKSLNLHVYALAGKNVKYPSLNDLYYVPSGNVNLQAEESESAEIGVVYQRGVVNNKLLFTSSATLFYNNIANFIQWEPTAFGFWKPTNLKSAETMGSELFIEVNQVKGKIKKQFNATYSYTASKNYEKQHEFDESRGKQLIYIPEHKGNVSLDLEVENFCFFMNYQYIGIRFISSDNEELLPSYSLLDASVCKSLKWKGNSFIALSAGVKNILDIKYQAIEWRPMPNRNYFIKISYQFKK